MGKFGDISKKARTDLSAWFAGKLQSLRSSLTPSKETLLACLTSVVVAIITIICIRQWGWLVGLTLGTWLACLALWKFGIGNTAMKVCYFLVVATVPVFVLLSLCGGWALREIHAAKAHSEQTSVASNATAPKPSAAIPPPVVAPPAPAPQAPATGTPGDGKQGALAKIPTPDAPARPGTQPPASTQKVVADSSNTQAAQAQRHCISRSSPDTPQFQSGKFYITLLECDPQGNLAHFSGTVLYEGPGRVPAGFSQISVSDSNGKPYVLENGEFGGAANLGNFYTERIMDTGVPIAFSFDAKLKEGGLPNAILNLVMPVALGPERAQSTVLFTGLILGD